MNDYEKLKYELNYLQIETMKDIKTIASSAHHMDLIIRIAGKDLHFEADFIKHILEQIDMKELIQPEKPKPRYKEGDEVWYLREANDIRCMKIDWVQDDPHFPTGEICYATPQGIIVESLLSPSRESLVDAQIDYWYKIKMDGMKDKLDNCAQKWDGEL